MYLPSKPCEDELSKADTNELNSSVHQDSLKKICGTYCPADYMAYAKRIQQAGQGDFPPFVLAKRSQYVARLHVMAAAPHLQRHVQALNALKLLDRTGCHHRK